jgi:putative ABC transport system permease protein
MAIPLKYNLRNLRVRWITTLMTASSIFLTVLVFVVLMALAQGLQTSLSATGHPLNLLLMREGAQSETQSSITRESLQVIRYLEGIAKNEKGEPRVSPELIVLMNFPRRGQAQGSNVTIRGLTPEGFSLRPEFKLLEGRLFQRGLREVIVSKRIAERFQNCGLGDRPKFAKGYWTVVGIFEVGNTAYASEIWTDPEDLGQDFDRDAYSVADDRRLHLKAQAEIEYYQKQTSAAGPIKALGIFIAGLMAVGASFAAMNTMYAAVARRTKEIGALRVLGFSRGSILLSFIIESILIAAAGALPACLASLVFNGVTAGTTNFATFSEVAFNYRVTPGLMLDGMIFAVLMGFVGGLFPAWRAAHENIVTALRST